MPRYKILVESVEKYNKEKIPFYTSVPSSEVDMFKKEVPADVVEIISDDEIYPDIPPMRGWESQQIVKSSFWKLEICINYLMVDSDSYFIKPFGVSDFMYDDHTPYTVLHEQKDLFSWTSKNHQMLGFNPKDSFSKERLSIMDVFGREGRVYDFGPGPVVWNYNVWCSLEEEYLKPNGLKFENLIQQMPSEFSWYGEWLLYRKDIDIMPMEPPFKFFHYFHQYQEYKDKGYELEHWAENYLGVVMQSSSGLPLRY